MSDSTSSEFTIGGRGLPTLLLLFVCAMGVSSQHTLLVEKKTLDRPLPLPLLLAWKLLFALPLLLLRHRDVGALRLG